MRSGRLLAVMATTIFFVGVLAIAQNNPNTDQGLKPYDSLHGGALDSVSVTGGNLFFHKTEYAAPQRGRVGLTFSLQYNNKSLRLQTTCGARGPYTYSPSGSPNPSGGSTGCTPSYFWRWNGSGVTLVNDQTLWVGGTNTDTGATDGTGMELYVMVYNAKTSDGSQHPLADTGNGYRSIDGSGILSNGPSLSGWDRSGMYGGGSQDPNGNFLSTDNSNNWIDTLGRAIPSPPAPPTTSTASPSSCPNLNLTYQPVAYAYTWSVPSPGGGTSQYLLCYASVFIRTALFAGSYINTTHFRDLSTSVYMLQSLVRPDGTVWTFTYDGANPNDTTSIAYGDLLKMGFPTGGSITYTYATAERYQGVYEPDLTQTLSRSVTSRTVDANDGTGPHTWTYNWGNPLVATSTTYTLENTVTDPLGNDTVHVISGLFGGPSLYETQARSYQGSKTSGTLLKTVNTDYSYSSNPFDNLGPVPNPVTAINVVPIRVTTIWANGQTSKEETDHDSAFLFRDPTWGLPIYPPQSSTTATYSGTLGTVSARREYDYGSGSAGALLKQTFTTYLWQGNGNYLTANLLDLPSSVIEKDGNGSRVAETDYTYDESQYLTAANITTQHGSAPGPVRGNLTTVSRWLNTSTNPVVSHTNWYDTGEVYQSIDPLGRTTTHSYDSYYVGAYSTKTCNALSQCVSGTYDFNTGLLTSFTDANGSYAASGNTPGDPAHTSNYSYDSMQRMTQAQLPPDSLGNRPTKTFNFPNANTVERLNTITTGLSDDLFGYFDGLGRPIKTVHTSAGNATVVTTYDALGHVASVTNPYFSTNDPTYGLVQTQYDALGRPTQITKQDGSISLAQYNSNCTITTDEAGKQRQACTDGLGRLVEVDEPQASAVGTNATASVTVSGAVNTAPNNGPPPLAAVGTRLASVVDSNGNPHTFYLGTNQHLWHLFWNSSGGWQNQDITAVVGGSGPATGSALSSLVDANGTIRVYFLDANQHIHETYCCGSAGWYDNDMVAALGFGTAASGSLLASTGSGLGSLVHLYYQGTNQHLYHMSYNPSGSGWSNQDVTAVTGTWSCSCSVVNTPVAGSALTSVVDSSGIIRVYFFDSHQHINETYNTGSGWFNTDMMAFLGINAAITGSALASTGSAQGASVNVFYQGANQHLYRMYLGWANLDVTANSGSAAPAAGSSLTSMVDGNGVLRTYFVDTNQHVHETWCCSSGNSFDTDMTGYLNTNAAAAGSALTSFGMVAGNPVHVHYLGANQHIYNMYLSGGGSWANQDASSAATVIVSDAGTVLLNVGSFTATLCFGNSSNSACTGQPLNRTAAQVASALAQAINAPGSPATATVSGSTISLVWKTPGPFTPAVGALSSNHDNPSLFANGSFTSAATAFGNGTGPSFTNAYATVYTYDTLGNLLNVTQKGGTTDQTQWRVRNFTYDSLSRLLTATNPESGTISYSYDADGNLLQKTSPAPNQTGSATQTISYCYDILNRVTGKKYSAQSCPLTSPVVTYTYDVGTNGIGHLTSLTDQAGSGSYTYDPLGRIASESRTIGGIQKSLSYTYNLDSSIATLTYPSAAVVTYTPDAAGRMLSAVDTGNNISYVTSAAYGPDSAVTGFVSGHSSTFNGITNTFAYNKRLQPSTMSASAPNQTVFSIGYDFHLGSGDNGNVFGITNYRDQNRNQTFTYDALNRLTSAQNAGTNCSQMTVNSKTEYWGNSYGYDPFGNLLQKTVTKCSAENLSVTAFSNNQLSGYTYDAAGNMTHAATTGVNYTFDQENRITGAGGYTYTYDADGNRVEKSNGSAGTIYWYMTPGIVAESDLTGALKSEYVFFDGERVARKDFSGSTTSVFYYFSDHLKTASVITDSGGTIKADSDYYPWGGELQFVNNDSNHYKFTSKERDSETGLDYFGARYYGNWLGRFITPDWAGKPIAVPYADFGNPQSLNLYTYVENSPLVHADLDGHQSGWEQVKRGLERAASQTGQAFKEAGRAVANGYANAVRAIGNAYSTAATAAVNGLKTSYSEIGKGLSENRNFSFEHISAADRKNIAKNVALFAAGGLAGEEEAAASRAAATMVGTKVPTLVGFSQAESGMIAQSLKALSGAGYDIGPIQQVVKADLGSNLGMSLSTPPTGMALGDEAFSSQQMLNHTMEEELLHLRQDLPNQTFSRGTAAAKEDEVNAARKFPDPRQ